MTETMGLLHGRHGSEIYSSDSETSLRPSRHVWAYGWHFLDSQLYSPNSLNAGYNPPLAAHPSLPPTHPLIDSIGDITVVVNKVAQKPAVLAS